jgi:hemerythrin-like domain-containing protein
VSYVSSTGIQSRLGAVFKNLFSFLFSRGSAEEHVARYVIREHDRGRSLTEILEDKYVQNRLTLDQQRRLLDRPEMIEAFSSVALDAAKASVSS